MKILVDILREHIKLNWMLQIYAYVFLHSMPPVQVDSFFFDFTTESGLPLIIQRKLSFIIIVFY